MALDRLSYTYLTNTIEPGTKDLVITSTAGMKSGDFFVCRDEAMKVQQVKSSSTVSVLRGVAGTKCMSHAAGQRFFYGNAHQFEAIRQSLTALVGDAGTYPDFLLPGQRAFDGGGNEYILLDLTDTVYSGTTVVFGNLFTASILAAKLQGSVAVTVSPATSGQYVWGQIYGYNAFVQDASATSGATSGWVCVAATSVSTPNVGMALFEPDNSAVYLIHGMFIKSAVTTATTGASSATGVAAPCWLNYPYTQNIGTATIDLTTSGGGA